MQTIYGVIADIHDKPERLPLAIEILKNRGAKKLIAVGDLGEDEQGIETALEHIGASKLDSFIVQGNHEEVGPCLRAFSRANAKFPNLINTAAEDPDSDASMLKRYEFPDHHLIFLPGAFDGPDAGFKLSFDKETGFYNTRREGSDVDEIISYWNTNLGDLEHLVRDAEKTIVVCHIPPSCTGKPSTSVDGTYLVQCDADEDGADESSGKRMLPLIVIKQRLDPEGRYGFEEFAKMLAQRFEVAIVHDGSEQLRELYDRYGITKAISAHFHESGHKGCNCKGEFIAGGDFQKELYWNPGAIAESKFGLYIVQDGKVDYRNLKL